MACSLRQRRYRCKEAWIRLLDPVREVVVQVACPVSHFAVAGYFGEKPTIPC